MKKHPVTVSILVAALAVAGIVASVGRPAKPEEPRGVLEISGRTQAVPRRRAILTNVPLHPVETVHVELGARVKKGQVLIELDADEPKADVRAKEAALNSATISYQEAKRFHEQVDRFTNSLSAQKCFEARAAAKKAEADERAARAALEAAKAELEHYTITAPIDGVVNLLNVNIGMVSRPGTAVWGEILDLSELDVRCEVTPEMADRITVGQSAEVFRKGDTTSLTGKVTFISFSADRTTGMIPVIVRVGNPDWRVRCEVPVQVRLGAPAKK